jgi:hypothetical protein
MFAEIEAYIDPKASCSNFGKACTIRVTLARRPTPLFRIECDTNGG